MRHQNSQLWSIMAYQVYCNTSKVVAGCKWYKINCCVDTPKNTHVQSVLMVNRCRRILSPQGFHTEISKHVYSRNKMKVMGGRHAVAVVGWGTMLQAGRSQVPFPMRSLEFSIDLILPAAIWPLASTQPLAELSTRNLTEDKGRPARKADKLAAICEPII
jgi:hypothetical protein